jgi:hypothetical protein
LTVEISARRFLSSQYERLADVIYWWRGIIE